MTFWSDNPDINFWDTVSPEAITHAADIIKNGLTTLPGVDLNKE